jgi:uncharacterized protein YbcI
MGQEPDRRGDQLAGISNAIVRILAESYGRGPTKAKTFMFDNYVFTVLEDILTTVEHTLVERGQEDLVRQVRLTFQEAVADRFTGAVSAALGREVIAYHSQVTFHPALASEIFVLAPEGRVGAA